MFTEFSLNCGDDHIDFSVESEYNGHRNERLVRVWEKLQSRRSRESSRKICND
jgi:hypothetical protein